MLLREHSPIPPVASLSSTLRLYGRLLQNPCQNLPAALAATELPLRAWTHVHPLVPLFPDRPRTKLSPGDPIPSTHVPIAIPALVLSPAPDRLHPPSFSCYLSSHLR